MRDPHSQGGFPTSEERTHQAMVRALLQRGGGSTPRPGTGLEEWAHEYMESPMAQRLLRDNLVVELEEEIIDR